MNVKLEFRDKAFRGTRTEEPLIAWLLQQKLIRAGWRVDREVPLPEISRFELRSRPALR